MTAVGLMSRMPGLVDLIIPKVTGVAQWRVQYALNFDSAWTTFQDVPRTGFRSASVKQATHYVENTKGFHRFTYNPADYAGYPADNRYCFLRLIPLNAAGVAGTTQRELALIPTARSSQMERVAFVLRGTAPSVADPAAIGSPPPATSLWLRFPRAVTAGKIINEDGVNELAIAFDEGASELKVPTSVVMGGQFFIPEESYHRDLFIRGSGGAVVFSMIFDLVGIAA